MKKQFELKSDKHRWLVDIDEELMEKEKKDNPKITENDIIKQIIDEARDEIFEIQQTKENWDAREKLKKEGEEESAIVIKNKIEGTDLGFDVYKMISLK